MSKPYAPACERNAAPILECLQAVLPRQCDILEIGSGTGQHASAFLSQQPDWYWQCSDLAAALPGIKAWLSELSRQDIPSPIELDVCKSQWPTRQFDAVFTANTLHIMPWVAVEQLFSHLSKVLRPGGSFLAYGPFNENGQFTSPSNAEFDLWLKQRSPDQGIRPLEELDALANAAGLRLHAKTTMPANNLMLHWRSQR